MSYKHICQNLSDLNFYRTNEKFVSTLFRVPFKADRGRPLLLFHVYPFGTIQTARLYVREESLLLCIDLKRIFYRHFRSHLGWRARDGPLLLLLLLDVYNSILLLI